MPAHKKTDQDDPEELEDSLVEIDEGRLDEEWIKQPLLYLKYAKLLAKAKYRLALAKAEVDVVEATIAQKVRSNPMKYGITGKETKGPTEAAVAMSAEYKLAVRKRNRRQHHVDVYDAACRALEHRKRALENLVDLHAQSYFSAPKAKGENGKKAVDKLKDAKRKAVQQKRWEEKHGVEN